MPLTTLDILLLVPLTYGLVRGLIKGLASELSALAGWIAGLLAAFYFSELVYQWALQFTAPALWKRSLVFVLILVFVVLSAKILGGWATKLFDFLALGFLNRLLGGIFGLSKWLLILLFLVYFFSLWQESYAWVEEEILLNSSVYQNLLNLLALLLPYWDAVAQSSL